MHLINTAQFVETPTETMDVHVRGDQVGVLCPVKTGEGLELELYKNLMHMVVLECSFMTVTFLCNLRACSDCSGKLRPQL